MKILVRQCCYFFIYYYDNCYFAVLDSISMYYCPNCNRSYKWKRALVRHLRYECGKEPSFLCPIDECSYKTKRKESLKIHLGGRHKVIC